MEIHYLGTAAAEGIPSLFCNCTACVNARRLGGKDIRTRSQALIDSALLVDFPPDTYFHFLLNKLDLSAVSRLLVTHSHRDHFYPEDLYNRIGIFAHDPTASVLNIYGNRHVAERLRGDLGGDTNKNGAKRLAVHELKTGETVSFDGYTVTPLRAAHCESSDEEALIYVIEKDGRTLLYGNDSGYFPEETWKALKAFRFHLVSLDSTLGRDNDYVGHMDLKNNSKVRLRLLEMGCADKNTNFVVVHFSHNAALTHGELIKEAGVIGFDVAYDGLKLPV